MWSCGDLLEVGRNEINRVLTILIVLPCLFIQNEEIDSGGKALGIGGSGRRGLGWFLPEVHKVPGMNSNISKGHFDRLWILALNPID